MRYTSYVQDQHLTIALAGEIDHHAAQGLRQELDRRITAMGPEKVVLDLSKTDFLDSSGLGLILGRVRVAETIGASLSVTGANRRIRRILELCGAKNYLDFA